MTHPLAYFLSEELRHSYASDVVDELVALKRHGGVNFDAAWKLTLRCHRPPMLWRLHKGFPGDESPLEFLQRHCDAAWHGVEADKPVHPAESLELAA